MNRQPQDTRSLGYPGNGAGNSPPLRESSPASSDGDTATAPLAAPWSAFIARILRPAGAVAVDKPD